MRAMLSVTLMAGAALAALQDAIYPGRQMNTTDGRRISARGAGFLTDGGKYYWYGEFNETKDIRNNAVSHGARRRG